MIHRHSLRSLILTAVLLGALGGCSHGTSTPATTVGVGVLLAVSGTTSLSPGGTVIVSADVLNDSNNQGVTWTLSGSGTLSSATATEVTYTAPATVVGVATATITATSKADSTKYSNVAVVTGGTPQILPQTSLPANQHVGYGTSVTATGGVAPFQWQITAGQLPPGLTLNGSTSAVLGISGTPTALGTWTFTVQVTDFNSQVAQSQYTIQVNPQASCLLAGTFAYKLNGFSKTGAPATRSGTFTVNSNGLVTGVEDLQSDVDAYTGRAVTTGQCQNQIGNHGQITFTSSEQTLTFTWGILTSLNEGFMQEMDGSGIAGTASFTRIDPTATVATGTGALATATGGYAFGVYGTDASAVRTGIVGRVVVNADGTVASGSGFADSNGSTGLVDSPVTGRFIADPTYPGRGTATLSIGGVSRSFVYYVIYGRDGRKVYLMQTLGAVGSATLVGDMTPQTDAPYSSASFAPAATPAILEIESATGTHYPTTSSTLAQFTSAAGVYTAIGDTATGGSNDLYISYPASASVNATSGRTTFSMGTGASLRTFVGYLYGVSTGYVVETTANGGNGVGFLEGQTNGPFDNFQGGTYLATTVIPGTNSPIVMFPTISVSGGTLSGGFSGQYALDSTTGRGLALLTRNVFGGDGLVFYIVNDTKLVVMGNGANALNTQLGYLYY